MIASSSQGIRYNPLSKADLLREGQYAELLRYGPDAQRWVTTDSINGQLSATTYYHGDFEMHSTSGGTRKFHYLGNGLLCIIPADNQPRYYYTMTDNVGSVVHIVNVECVSEFGASYDAWGRQTITANGIGFFHEVVFTLSQDTIIVESFNRFDFPKINVRVPDLWRQNH